MKNIPCVICLSSKNYHILYPKNFNLKDANEITFSARRIPDRYHYRIVKCKKCGLIYSNPILEEKEIKNLYKRSKFTYDKEVDNLSQSYGYCLDQIKPQIINKDRFLEIGCGNGFFLKEASKRGFKNLWGVEPSIDAIKKSSFGVGKIINSTLESDLFKKDYFDFICFFQTLDHIVDPNKFLKICFKILKKKGLVLCITHDSNSILTKILKEKSPIFDLEHVCLFNKQTLVKIFNQNGFKVIKVFDVANRYSLAYWIKMSPLNRWTKKFIEKASNLLGFNKITLRLNVGNIGILAKKI